MVVLLRNEPTFLFQTELQRAVFSMAFMCLCPWSITVHASLTCDLLSPLPWDQCSLIEGRDCILPIQSLGSCILFLIHALDFCCCFLLFLQFKQTWHKPQLGSKYFYTNLKVKLRNVIYKKTDQ